MNPLSSMEIENLLAKLPDWKLDGHAITRTFSFRDYHQTIAFVNATAWISHREDHHPDLLVTYNTCRISYSTHSAGGLTEKDFGCAALVDALFKP